MNRRDFIKYGTILVGAGGISFFCNSKKFLIKYDNIENPLTETRPCKIPFVFCEIQEHGNVRPCCLDFLKNKTPAQSIENVDLLEVWNGKAFSELREKVIKSDFSMCNRDICTLYTPCSADEIPADYTKGPKEIKICYDYECNYNCLTCRDKVKTNTPEEMKLFDEVFLPKIVKTAANAEVVSVLGSGDPLASRHTRHLIKELIKEYPNIKFNLFTNGFFLDEKNLTELGIQNNIHGLSVSVDSVCRETYKKILRTDAFDIVMKNLELMSEWNHPRKFEWFLINFVVHSMNYKEMPEFVKLAQKLDATAFFTTYRPWGTAEYHKKYNEAAVFEPSNEHYKELVKILHNPIFKDKEHCLLEARLFDIANS